MDTITSRSHLQPGFALMPQTRSLSARNPLEGATPVSPPTGGRDPAHYACYIDHANALYEICWEGTMEVPELWPVLSPSIVSVSPVRMSTSMAKVWAESVFHGYGSNACIRSHHDDRFPIVKLTHPHTEARLLVQHEFRLLKELTTTQVPIPQFDEHPLEDEDGVFGYSMELLHRIPYEESKSASYAREVEHMVTLLHEQGFAHGDLSPSNVMRNSQGRLVFIDFGFTGRLGQDVPACVPRWVYRDDTVHARGDDENLLRLVPFQQCRSTL